MKAGGGAGIQSELDERGEEKRSTARWCPRQKRPGKKYATFRLGWGLRSVSSTGDSSLQTVTARSKRSKKMRPREKREKGDVERSKR